MNVLKRRKLAKLDLPVFDPRETLYTTTDEYRQIARLNPKARNFLRLARLIPPPGTYDLKEALSRTEEEFEAISEKAGALVVGHTYGLYPSRLTTWGTEMLPEGFTLAARVDIVNVGQMDYRASHRLSTACYDYNQNRGSLLDMRSTQFGQGVTRNPEDDGTEKIWLLDIEPLHR